MAHFLYQDDLPSDWACGPRVAVDTETMGLKISRDRLCLVQISSGDGDAHLVKITDPAKAVNLKRVLADDSVEKIFHFARFDLAMILKTFGITCRPVYCTRTASRLTRTNTDRHGLKDLCKEFLGIEMSKAQQSSDWAAAELTDEQQAYAASDVLYLHELRDTMAKLLDREGRTELAAACFDFLPDRAALDVAGFEDDDIFAH